MIIIFKILFCGYKIIHDLAPSYLEAVVSFRSSSSSSSHLQQLDTSVPLPLLISSYFQDHVLGLGMVIVHSLSLHQPSGITYPPISVMLLPWTLSNSFSKHISLSNPNNRAGFLPFACCLIV